MRKYFTMILAALFLVSCGSTKTFTTQDASTKYKIGDYYNQNGLEGIVVIVDNSGQHGTIMSLESCKKDWCSDKELKFETNAFYESDGQKNMEAIEKYVKENNVSWEKFPLFKWSKDLGEGWYIPSKDEALEIWYNINNNASYTYSKRNFKRFDRLQRKYGGDNLVDTRFYIGSKLPWIWKTSTEADGGNVYAVQFGLDFKSQLTVGIYSTIKAFPHMKNQGVHATRAIHKF